jgi:hypothetical protein
MNFRNDNVGDLTMIRERSTPGRVQDSAVSSKVRSVQDFGRVARLEGFIIEKPSALSPARRTKTWNPHTREGVG